MSTSEIKNIEELLSPVLGTNKLLEVRTSKLTSAGDNYGGLLLAADLIISENSKKNQIRAVAKMFPNNKFMQQMFKSEITFPNEVGFYNVIAPCLRQFQKEQGFTKLIDSSPDFIAARFSLDPASSKPDEDAVLLIKNITEEGFSTIDRMIGFDKDQAELILEKMAELQATFLALNLKNPKIFEEKMKPFFPEFKTFDAVEGGKEDLITAILNSIKDDEFCSKHLEKVRQALESSLPVHLMKNQKWHESPFLSFVHVDMWTNNIMLKVVDGKTVDVKFVDYQIYEYSSLTRDILFFIFSSVQVPVVQKHCDHLLLHYYNTFVEYLRRLKCDTSRFSLQSFYDELASMANKAEFIHIMLMLSPIYAEKGNVQEIESIKEKDMIESRDTLSQAGKQRASFVIQEFLRRQWI